ncbi:MAG: agmatine deiminase family protein [Chloroherpetonaceae bacterium]|nr:agmatine deiminase family protein [Chloroherpetonaceae bacterium]
MTLKEQGFFMPPEWAEHEATWLSWPHKQESWPDMDMNLVWEACIEIVRFLCPHEKVCINVLGAEMEADIRRRVEEAGIIRDAVPNIQYFHFPTNDAWCRDHGPMFVLRHTSSGVEKVILDWDYNAWGGKYPPFDLDDDIPSKIAALKNLPVHYPKIIMEGGSIDTNGKGVLLTTTSCLLNPNRNPHLNQEQIEKSLIDHLGMSKILWLGEGIVGDDTDGHIDDISRFVDANTIVTAIEDDPSDENYEILKENYEKLKTFTDQDGNPFRIVTIPMPTPVIHDGQRSPASYANFYIANNTVLVPTFRSKNDIKALEVLQKCFPTRRVQGIDCYNLIWGLGAIHCLSHEEPSMNGLKNL